MPRIFTYIVEHDVGFAPNPFGGLCSLANCKPQIRRTAALGDYVIGTGSGQDGFAGRLIYWMRIDEIISFDEYWNEPRFARRRPVLNGSQMQQHGDNIYHTVENGAVRQVDSFHSEPDGTTNLANLERDTGKTNRVLLSREFVYYGEAAPVIPPDLASFVHKTQGHKCRFSEESKAVMLGWLTGMEHRGLQGLPVGWRQGSRHRK